MRRGLDSQILPTETLPTDAHFLVTVYPQIDELRHSSSNPTSITGTMYARVKNLKPICCSSEPQFAFPNIQGGRLFQYPAC